MSRSERKPHESGGALGATALMDRLNHVRKRKRAFGGQTVDMEAIRQKIAEERRRKGDR
jgi:hypothetical protein